MKTFAVLLAGIIILVAFLRIFLIIINPLRKSRSFGILSSLSMLFPAVILSLPVFVIEDGTRFFQGKAALFFLVLISLLVTYYLFDLSLEYREYREYKKNKK